MSIFFDEDTASVPSSNENWSKGERTGLGENAGKAYSAFRRSELMTSERNNLDEEYINIINIAQKAGHSDFTSPLDQEFNPFTGTGAMDPSEIKNKEQLQVEFWNKVSERKKTDENFKSLLSEAGLDSLESMEKTIASKSQNAWKDFYETNARATTGGKIGGVAGMGGAAFTDPIMLMTIPISFGYSVPATFGKAALKVALMEGIIAASAETIIQTKVQPYRKELGFEDAGFETGAKTVAMVAGASAVLSPLLLGVFKAFGKGIDQGKKLLAKKSVEDLQQIHKEIGDVNPKYKDTDLTSYELPKKDSPFDDTPAARTEHMERTNTAVRAMENGEAIDLPPPQSKIVEEDLVPPPTLKQGEFANIYDNQGNIINVEALAVSKSGTSAKVKLPDGTVQVISLDPKSTAFINIKNPNYIIRSPNIGFQGKKISELSNSEFNAVKEKLLEHKKYFEKDANRINYQQGTYKDLIRDLNAFNAKVDKSSVKINEVKTENPAFNKNETKLVDDIEGTKNFDVPTEAAYKAQSNSLEADMFDEGIALAIKTEGGATSAAKTVPTGKPLAKIQEAVSGSQVTEAAPSSAVLATAQTKPPLIRGSTTSSVGDFNSITKDRVYHISNNFNEIVDGLSKVKNEVISTLEPLVKKYNGEMTARIKTKKSIQKKLSQNLQAQHMPDYLNVRINTTSINEAKLILSDLNKQYKLIHLDDFLDDVGRSIQGSEYRAIHAQVLTKDGFSFKLQIRLKDLKDLTDKSYVVNKQIKYQKDVISKSKLKELISENDKIKKELKSKYFEIKDKEFSLLKTTDPLDQPIAVGQRFDELTGEVVVVTKTAREAFEEQAKNTTMLNRLKDCI